MRSQLARQRNRTILQCEPLEDRRLLTITVDTLADGIGVPGTSLREALVAASSGETINFSVTGTIHLTNLSQLAVNKSVHIVGPGAGQLTINALDPTPGVINGDGRRVFAVDDGNAIAMSNVRIANLRITGADSDLAGGAIYSREHLVIEGCEIAGNGTTSTAGGGGIYGTGGALVQGTLTIRDSTLANNSVIVGADTSGGGAVRVLDTDLTLQRTTIRDNFASRIGGGVSASGGVLGAIQVTFTDSTVHSNIAQYNGGGAYLSNSIAVVSNSTFSGNEADASGGGLEIVNGSTSIRHSTITANRIDNQGHGGGVSYGGSGSLLLNHSIVSGNYDSGGCGPVGCTYFPGDVSILGAVSIGYSLYFEIDGGPFTDQGGNIIDSPGLDALADNGGPTWTHQPEPSSPAINAGSPSAVPGVFNVPHYDQRGMPFARVSDGRIDFGAVEVQPITPDGDFNNDGLYDCVDIDALVGAIAAATNAPNFDLTQDGLVNLADRDAWLAEAGANNLGAGRAYRLGDASLDGVVDGSDFGIWNANKFTATVRWCRGDFSADGVVDGSDFGIWNANKFTSSDAHAGISASGDPRNLKQSTTDTDDTPKSGPIILATPAMPLGSSPIPLRREARQLPVMDRIIAEFAGGGDRSTKVVGRSGSNSVLPLHFPPRLPGLALRQGTRTP